MFSKCANPECGMRFVYGQGRFFRFHKNWTAGQEPPNTHSVQHFWLCDQCCRQFTLELQDGAGVVIKTRPDIIGDVEVSRWIAAA
jgi:hypothetical protein